MNNYYQVLEIDQNTDAQTIKRAYVRLLKRHPPEKDPEQFKIIREAYETLSSPKSRAEYDALDQHGDDIEKYREYGNEAMEQEDYPRAISWFKKILVIEPSLGFARNLLGLAYLYNQELEKGIAQFERIVKEDPDNPTYLFNLGTAYEEAGNMAAAESNLILAHELDKINNNIVFTLVNLYLDQKQFGKAQALLRSTIMLDGAVDFQDFLYYFKLVEVSIISGDIGEAEIILEEVESIIPEDQEEKEYVAWKFAKLAAELYDLKAFDLATRILRWANKIDPENKAIGDLYEQSEQNHGLYTLFKKLADDNRIIKPLLGFIFYYLYGDDLDEDELEKNRKENWEDIQSYIDVVPIEVKRSIAIIKKEYTAIYEEREDYFDLVYDEASNKVKVNDQWEKIENNINVSKPLKGIIALWLSSGISDYEREQYFNNFLEALGREPKNKLVSSVSLIHSQYPEIYQLNSDFFDNLGKYLRDETPSSKNSTNTSSSCFVATAAFGTPWAQEINVLRQWRDTVLVNKYQGRLFIKFYYSIGPYLAKIVERSEPLKRLCRYIIHKIIKKLA